MPLVLGTVSPWRAEALLMPMTVAAARLSVAIQVALLGAAVVIWVIMATLFINGVLV